MKSLNIVKMKIIKYFYVNNQKSHLVITAQTSSGASKQIIKTVNSAGIFNVDKESISTTRLNQLFAISPSIRPNKTLYWKKYNLFMIFMIHTTFDQKKCHKVGGNLSKVVSSFSVEMVLSNLIGCTIV